MTTALATDRKVRAETGAMAWLNAAIVSGQDKERAALFRTLSVEFFPRGIQFIGCDGTALFRTWAPYSDVGDFSAPHPEWDEAPDDAVVVLDGDKFALGFMRTLLAAVGETITDLTFAIGPAREDDAPVLGDQFSEYVLNLHALGQRLSCQLYDGPFPDWRRLQFGLQPAELVDGMTLAPRMFAAVGKLKGVNGVDCSFRGSDKAIEIASLPDATPSLRGLLMPMRRRDKAAPKDDGQTQHGEASEE